jgi:hypothetical protein
LRCKEKFDIGGSVSFFPGDIRTILGVYQPGHGCHTRYVDIKGFDLVYWVFLSSQSFCRAPRHWTTFKSCSNTTYSKPSLHLDHKHAPEHEACIQSTPNREPESYIISLLTLYPNPPYPSCRLKVDAYKTAWQLAVEKYHRGALEKYENMRDDLEDRLEDLTRSRGQAYATIAGQQRTIGRLLERLQAAKSGRKRGAGEKGPGVQRKKRRVSDAKPAVMGAGAVTVAGGAVKKQGEVSVRDGIPRPAVFRRGEKVMDIRQGVPEAAKMTGGGVVNLTDGVPLPRRGKRRGTPQEPKIDIDLISSEEEDEPPKAIGAEGGTHGREGKRKRGDGGGQNVRMEDVPFRVPRYPIGPPRLDPNVGFFKYGRHWRTYWKRDPPPSILYENEMDDSE